MITETIPTAKEGHLSGSLSGREYPVFVFWNDSGNQVGDWQNAANGIRATLLCYFSPEPSETPQTDTNWASLAEAARKRWSKDNPF